MLKWIVGLLLLANLVLLGWMRWGSALTTDADAALTQAALNPDKIRLLPAQSASAANSAPVATPGGMSLTLTPVSVPAAAPVPAAASAPAAALNHDAPKELSCAEWGEFAGEDLGHAQQALVSLKLGERLSQRAVEHNRGY